jgi:hypothetical protein
VIEDALLALLAALADIEGRVRRMEAEQKYLGRYA